MKFKLLSMEDGGFVQIASEGEVTGQDVAAGVKNPLETLLGADWATKKVLLDFSGTRYIDSAAIGWLISCQKDFKKSGGVLVIHSIPQSVRQILDLLKIGKVMNLAENALTARAMLVGVV